MPQVLMALGGAVLFLAWFIPVLDRWVEKSKMEPMDWLTLLGVSMVVTGVLFWLATLFMK